LRQTSPAAPVVSTARTRAGLASPSTTAILPADSPASAAGLVAYTAAPSRPPGPVGAANEWVMHGTSVAPPPIRTCRDAAPGRLMKASWRMTRVRHPAARSRFCAYRTASISSGEPDSRTQRARASTSAIMRAAFTLSYGGVVVCQRAICVLLVVCLCDCDCQPSIQRPPSTPSV